MEVGKGTASVVVNHKGEIVLLESSVRFCGTASAGGACTAFALELPEDASRDDLPLGEIVVLSLVWTCGKSADVEAKITQKKDGLVYFDVVKVLAQEDPNPNQQIIDDILEVVSEPEVPEHTEECDGECEPYDEEAVVDCTPVAEEEQDELD